MGEQLSKKDRCSRTEPRSPNNFVYIQHFDRVNANETSKVRISGLYERNPSMNGGIPHKDPVIREAFPFHYIMISRYACSKTPTDKIGVTKQMIFMILNLSKLMWLQSLFIRKTHCISRKKSFIIIISRILRYAIQLSISAAAYLVLNDFMNHRLWIWVNPISNRPQQGVDCVRIASRCTGEHYKIDSLVQGRRNFSALAMVLRNSCTKPSRLCTKFWFQLAGPTSGAQQTHPTRYFILCIYSYGNLIIDSSHA